MTSYRWTEDEDDIALDAITVGVRSDTRILRLGGVEFGQRDAVVYWPDWLANGVKIIGAMEGPMAVPFALARAEELRQRYGFNRIVIWVQHRELWDNSWGELAPQPGLAIG